MLARRSLRESAALRTKGPLRRVTAIAKIGDPHRLIRWVYYVFIFSLPFEAADLGIGSTLPKLTGVLLTGLAMLQPHLCFRRPPKAFWCFVIYLLEYGILILALMASGMRDPEIKTLIVYELLRLIQMLVLFWISYNLMHHEKVVKGTLLALAGGAILLAMLQFWGFTATIEQGRRISAFGENPNSTAMALSLGLLALVGLAYGRGKHDFKTRVFFWLFGGVILVALVETGSRGTMLALLASLGIFFVGGKSLGTKVKLGFITLLAIAVLGVASYQIEAVKTRWERTIFEGEVSGRDEIHAEAMGMILEQPLAGWGPVYHYYELGSRRGERSRDPHNLYLWLLAEGGLFGAIPFLAGLWLCWLAAWRARRGIQGILPVVMLLFLLVVNLSGSEHNRKLFWVTLAYALASSSYAAVTRPRKMAVPSRSAPMHRVRRVAKARPRDISGVPGPLVPNSFPSDGTR